MTFLLLVLTTLLLAWLLFCNQANNKVVNIHNFGKSPYLIVDFLQYHTGIRITISWLYQFHNKELEVNGWIKVFKSNLYEESFIFKRRNNNSHKGLQSQLSCTKRAA